MLKMFTLISSYFISLEIMKKHTRMLKLGRGTHILVRKVSEPFFLTNSSPMFGISTGLTLSFQGNVSK